MESTGFCIAASQYRPSAEYFAHWFHAGGLILEAHEHYQKRSWRNRTAILGHESALWLTVPLRKGKNNGMPVQDVQISFDEPWHKQHYHSISTAYGKTAFFEEVHDEIKSILLDPPGSLWELNYKFMNWLREIVRLNCSLAETTSFIKQYPEEVPDIRHGVPAGITHLKNIPVYQQVNCLPGVFIPNLSILDVICHLGPHTTEYIELYARRLYTSSL